MKVYLNKAFLVNFLLADATDDLHFFIKRYLICSSSGAEIIVDFDLEEAYEDPVLRAIVRQIARKIPVMDTSFIQKCQKPEFHNNADGRLFFIDNEPNTDIVRGFGCFITDSKNLSKGSTLFYSEKFRINSQNQDWKLLENVKHPCNALVITDNYLFLNDKNGENLFSILDYLMPKFLNKNFGFHLTIIGYVKEDDSSLDDQCQKLKAHLENKFNYGVNITILRKKYHDRYIYSNYYRIVSPRGFSLFCDKIISNHLETTIDCAPITDFGNHSSLEQTIKQELLQIRQINNSYISRSKFAGNRINRLLM